MRNLGLDIVRFFAVTLVLFRHADIDVYHSPFLTLVKQGGWVGVDLFFVLSGFLISSLLFKEYKEKGRINLQRFLIRRGFKIYPSFWLLVLFYASYLFWVKRPPYFSQVVCEILLVQNYLGGFLGFTWSLAVEEHFYLALALLFFSLGKFKKSQTFDAIPVLFFLIAAICLLLRNHYIVPAHIFNVFPYSYFSHLRMDSLFFGVFISYFYHFRNLEEKLKKIPTSFLFIVGASLLSPAFIVSPYLHRWLFVWGFILLYVGSGLIVLGAQRISASKKIVLRIIAELGAASYSIYLWHLPVRDIGLIFFKKNTNFVSPNLQLPVFLLGSFFVGWLMQQLIEIPMLKLRDSFFKREQRFLGGLKQRSETIPLQV